MTRVRALVPVVVCLVLGLSAPAASAAPTFHPRVLNALGLAPPVNSQGNSSLQSTENGVFTSVLYHGGPTMTGGVTVHTIFWAPSGYAFEAAGNGVPGYAALLEKYYTDVAADSTTAHGTCNTSDCNDFTVENQYGWGITPAGITSGDYAITFNDASQAFTGTQTLSPTDDVILDSDAYPASGNGAGQCSSPLGEKACITDGDVQNEIDSIVEHTVGTPRGLNNLWFVFLPPDVDECITTNVCGTNDFAGYHSLSNVGHGVTIYAVAVDPIIETGGIAQGADPEGNPGRRGDDRYRRPRDQRGDERPGGRRLDGSRTVTRSPTSVSSAIRRERRWASPPMARHTTR